MRKSKLSMLVIAGLCALGVSSFATSSEEAVRQKQTDGAVDRSREVVAAPGTERSEGSERPRLTDEPRRIKDDGRNQFGEAFERMQRNMDLMDAYFDKHFKKGQGRFTVGDGKVGLERDQAKKRMYLDQRMRDEKRRIIFSVSRKADLIDNQPLTFMNPGAAGAGSNVKVGQPASELADDDRIPSAGPYDEWSEEDIKNSSILDKLEQIPPVSLDKFEAWDEKKEAPGLEAPGDVGATRLDVNINLNEKTRELEVKNRNELSNADKKDRLPSLGDGPTDIKVESSKAGDDDAAKRAPDKDEQIPDDSRKPIDPDRGTGDPGAKTPSQVTDPGPRLPGLFKPLIRDDDRVNLHPIPMIMFDPVKIRDEGSLDKFDRFDKLDKLEPIGVEKNDPPRRNP